MAEFISREALIKTTKKTIEENNNVGYAMIDNDFLDLIADAPAEDVVEVVRCKDCKHWKNRKDVAGNIVCSAVCMKIHTESYCSCGEKIDEG